MTKLGLDVAALARATGKSRQSVYLWLRGETKSLRGENLVRLARVLETTPEWLSSGRGATEATSVPKALSEISEEAAEIAIAWDSMPENKRRIYREAILHDAAVAEVFPEISGAVAMKASYHAMIERFRRDRAKLERQMKLKLDL